MRNNFSTGVLACAILSAPVSVMAADLFDAVITGQERSIYQDPPDNVLNEVGGSQAHAVDCTIRIGAQVGYAGTVPATGDLDDIGYYAHVQCAKPAGPVVTIGRTGVTKQITQLALCETPGTLTTEVIELALSYPAGYNCSIVHNAGLPGATTADTVSASAEFDTDLLNLDRGYSVLARVRLSNPNTDFQWVATPWLTAATNGGQAAWECIELASNTYECIFATAFFRYMP